MKPKLFFFVALALLAIGAAAVGSGYVWGINRLSRQADSLRTKISDSEIRDERLLQLRQLEKNYRQYSSLSELADSALPQGKRQSELVLQLRQIITGTGMAFPGIVFPPADQPGPRSQTVASGGGIAIPLTFSLTGSYSQMQAFLQNMERFSRTTNITTINISKATGGNLNFTVGMTVQVLP